MIGRRLIHRGERGGPSAPPPKRGARSAERGVAMIIAVISIAILTAVAVDFRYNSHVDLRTAANQRDEAQAYFLAKSSVQLSRLVLSFQRQLDNIRLPGMPGQGQGGNLNIQLYKLARIDCHMLRSMVSPVEGAREEEAESARPPREGEIAAPAARSFGGFEGCFETQIESEDTKINLHRLEWFAPDLVQSLSDRRMEFLFEGEDRNRVKVTPQELLVNITDWQDPDEVQTYLDLSNALQPFRPGTSDENFGYSNYDPRYEAKNAPFDSLDELYLVHGVNDRIMAALRERFTVYLSRNAKLNINSDDPRQVALAIQLAVGVPDPRLQNPLFMTQLINAIRAARMMSFVGLNVQQFLLLLQQAGLPVNPQARQMLGTESTTYKIHANGTAGAITKKITAVVRTEGAAAAIPGMPQQVNLGKLVYWREE